MLPPGHIAGGYLATYALLKIAQPELPLQQIQQLLWLGVVFGFIPDLDIFASFIREKALRITERKNDHRRYPTHVPLLWALAGLGIYLFATSTFSRWVGLVLWTSSWSHFVLDSLQYGLMWLWPFSNRLYALSDAGLWFEPPVRRTFFGYWWDFVVAYLVQYSLTAYSEIVVILLAWIVFYV